MDLTPKQESFCREYAKDHNGTQAAIRAGYAAGSAEVTASRLLRNDKVQQFLAKLKEEIVEKNDLDASQIISELKKIAFFRTHNLYNKDQKGWIFQDPECVPSETLDAVAEIAIVEIITEDPKGTITRETRSKFKPACKLKALEMLGKYIGMFGDKKPEPPPSDLLPPPELSYTQWHNLSEDEKTIFLATGALPETLEKNGLSADSE